MPNIPQIRNRIIQLDQATLNGKLDSIQAQVGANAIDSLKASYDSQIAGMNQRFTDVLNQNNQMNNLAAGLNNCCCENRQAIANLRAELLATYAAGIQAIKDELCADRIAAKDEKIADLTRQLQMAQLSASQNEQTARLEAGQRVLANEVEQYIVPKANPAYIVQNPNCCQPNFSCGMA